MTRSFLVSLLVATGVSSCGAFVPQTTPTSPDTSGPASESEELLVRHVDQSRREAFESLAAGVLGTLASVVAAAPSPASAVTVVDTDEFGNKVEYEIGDDKPTAEAAPAPAPAPAPSPKSRVQ